jgi:hypothetical protein
VLLSQNYAEAHLKVHEITSVLIDEQQNYAEANRQFKELFSKYDYRFRSGLETALKNRLCNMNGTWQKDSADIDFYLKRIASIGMRKIDILDICSCTNNATLAIIEQKINIYDSIANSKWNKELISLIDSMFKEDIRVRTTEVSKEESWRIDSLNLVVLKDLMVQYGRLLGVRDFDVSTMNKYTALIHHFEPEMILETWHDKILESIYNGDLCPIRLSNSIDYAIFKDHQIIDGKFSTRYSRYGTTNFRGISHPVKDIDQANKLRKEIGLMPLDEWLKKENLRYDVEAWKERIQLIEE